ncbi:MAG: hypothetical protein AAGI23_08225 [Bacteroidota bacterium]
MQKSILTLIAIAVAFSVQAQRKIIDLNKPVYVKAVTWSIDSQMLKVATPMPLRKDGAHFISAFRLNDQLGSDALTMIAQPKPKKIEGGRQLLFFVPAELRHLLTKADRVKLHVQLEGGGH